MASFTSALEPPRSPLLPRSKRPDRRRGLQWQQWPDLMCEPDHPNSEPLQCSHPDLEDESLIAWGLRKSKDAKGEGIDIDVLYGDTADLKWSRCVDDEELSRRLKSPPPLLRVCFIDTLKSDSSWLPGNFSPRQKTIRILHEAGLSGVLLCNLYSEHSYWAKMGNQRYIKNDDQGKLTSFEVCYQYRCGLDTGVSFIHSKRTQEHTTYFCINYPSGARERLETIVRDKNRRAVLQRQFFLDTLAADDSLKQWQFDIGQKRLDLFKVEETLEKPLQVNKEGEGITSSMPTGSSDSKNSVGHEPKDPQRRKNDDVERQFAIRNEKRRTAEGHDPYNEHPDKRLRPANGKGEQDDFDNATHDLHDMVRHWLGLRQDCEDLLAQLRFLHDTYNKTVKMGGLSWSVDQMVDAGESFEVLISQCDICVRWTQVYYDRTQTRIGLLFHLANQRTAADTARIAEQTQQDSASMITIAAVTLVFLPGTFICTIVSTNLFDFGEQGLQVSSQWWILLAAALPLTMVVLIVWEGWRRFRLKKQKRKARSTKREMQKYGVSM